MSTGAAGLERSLVAGLRLLQDFAERGHVGAQRTLERVEEILFGPIEVQRGRLPHQDVAWSEKRAGRGGKRSTGSYRELANAFGIELHPTIGWVQARDAARALEMAKARVDAEHVNFLLNLDIEEG